MNDAARRSTAILSFDVDAESPILALGAEHRRNAMAMTHQAFGPLVGVPRILRLLAEYEIRATFFVPGATALRYPDTVAAIAEAGHEIGHHSHLHHSALDLDAAAERQDFEAALEALESVGVKPAGHRAAMWEATWQTPELVAEYGLAYDSSLMDADTAYVLETARGAIAEIPPHWSLDDWEQYAFLPRPDIGSAINSPLDVARMWVHELDAARRHGALFVLTCHPFLSGRAGRVEALRTVIEAGLDRGDVDFATCHDVAQATLADAQADRRPLRPPPVV
jgi:peptidoglycan/xylan/chitin deacetylase (PgdA/CDA1 family)